MLLQALVAKGVLTLPEAMDVADRAVAAVSEPPDEEEEDVAETLLPALSISATDWPRWRLDRT